MTREQLEEQAECNRAAVAGTLDELKRRLTPGEIVDEVLAYMQGGGNEFLNNLGKQVTDNPMPVTLMGAGLAWFLVGKQVSSSNGARYVPPSRPYSGDGSTYRAASSYTENAAAGMGEAAHSAMHKAGEMASSAAEHVNGAAHAVGDAASNAASAISGAANAVGDAASNAYHQAADAYHQAAGAASGAYNQAADRLAMVKDSAIQMEEKTMAAAKQTMDFMQEQPLILAGVGFALGAALGAALPSTDLEDELLGETSDEMKETAKTVAVDQLDKAKEMGHKLGDALQKEAGDSLDTLSSTASGSMDVEDEESDTTSTTGRSSWSNLNPVPH